jgi:hypothetical protein
MSTLPTTGEKILPSQEQNRSVFLLRRHVWNAFWQIGVFRFIVAFGIGFFLLTGIAMLVYPGGTMTDPHQLGYALFANFLSDLGRTLTPSGQNNLTSRLLFTIALTMGAVGIMLSFAAFTQFFTVPDTSRWLSRLGAICDLITGLCFIGVAFAPMNRAGKLHNLFFYTAYLSFLIAFLLLFLAVLRTPGFPRRSVLIFTAFAFLLAGSLLDFIFTLLFGPASLRPASGTLAWEIVQATGEKIIVAASLLTWLIQALILRPLPRESAEPPSDA